MKKSGSIASILKYRGTENSKPNFLDLFEFYT